MGDSKYYVATDDSGRPCKVVPSDPNAKQGPAGYSDAAFTGVQQPWLYTVYFENLTNAGAYARQIRITDPLDSNLDSRTFRLQEIVFGNVTIRVPTNRSFFQTRIALPPPHATNIVADISAGLDYQSGGVFWSMNAIDLNTGLLVESLEEGLLPPNNTNHIGEGHVTYSIRPRSGLPTGTVITNKATIVFDTNEPMDTNPTTNTVDALPPTSAVSALAAVVETNFTVNWFGNEDPRGSGVASYDVYVSDNGAAWQLWQNAVTGFGATYNGEPGHWYFFYSRARDNAGNLEPAPVNYQAMTFVTTNQPPVLSLVTDQTAVMGGTFVLTNRATDANGSISGLTFRLTDAPVGMTIDPTNGVICWAPAPWQLGTTNLVTVTVTDNGQPPRSVSQSFVVVVADDRPLLQIVSGDYRWFQLNVSGQTGRTYDLESSTALTAGWSNVTSLTLTNPIECLLWSNQVEATRFFRLRQR